MKNAKLTPTQEKLIEGLVAEFTQVNVQFEKEKKANPKGAFDMSAIVSDVADKQRVVNENSALKTFWTKRISVQMDADVKKLNKALDKMGFFVETNMQYAFRKNPDYIHAKTFYPRIVISHKHLKKTSEGWSNHPVEMDIDYVITHDHSKRADLDTPCGFQIQTKPIAESGYQMSSGLIGTHTIEELFVKIQPWIKRYYEEATLVKA
jgi:hypothetical protein